jgi:hypothetical protein
MTQEADDVVHFSQGRKLRNEVSVNFELHLYWEPMEVEVEWSSDYDVTGIGACRCWSMIHVEWMEMK